LIKSQNGDILAYFHIVLNRKKNYLTHNDDRRSQDSLVVQRCATFTLDDDRYTETHAAEPSSFAVEVVIEEMRMCHSPGTD
jgi:hypothetical protein